MIEKPPKKTYLKKIRGQLLNFKAVKLYGFKKIAQHTFITLHKKNSQLFFVVSVVGWTKGVVRSFRAQWKYWNKEFPQTARDILSRWILEERTHTRRIWGNVQIRRFLISVTSIWTSFSSIVKSTPSKNDTEHLNAS